MKRTGALVVVFTMTLSALPLAHVTVRPRESKAGAEERYTVRVPTEGTVSTTMVRLEVPAGVIVLDVEKTNDATVETEKQDDRIVSITWKKEIKPKEAAEFAFRARNPESHEEIAWKAHQQFADGTVADWVGAAGDRRPAAITKLGK
jgi:uncharacterized protein YcnI